MPLESPPRRRWSFPEPPDAAAVDRLRRELRLPGPICRLLVQRGYAAAPEAREFLRPHPGQIHAPRLAGIDDAVERIGRAIDARETILVHGDYDVDGICSTALLTRALRDMGARVEPFVPHRITDGYDLSEAGVAAAAHAGAKLIITADCGIVAHEAVAAARRAGIDVIVTDHHTPGAELPAAVAVVNPNQPGCPYPNRGLAGVGVAYKLCCALAEARGVPTEALTRYLDLVAVATVADLAPLSGENRALVRWGLRVLVNTPNPGLRALLRGTGLDRNAEITAGQVGYILAPRINAVGRMGDASLGVRLLLTDDAAEAERIAATLEEDNRSRQETDARTLREALQLLERDYDPARDRGVVLAAEGWHPGVIGIVASRVVERIHRPTVMIALAGDADGKGSARSVPGFHLYEAMRDCADHLTRFGGHRAAAGCSLRPDRVDAFRAAFNARAGESLTDELLVPEVRIDLELGLDDANEALLRVLRHAAPFGIGNPAPVLAVRGVDVVGSPRTVGRGHLKATFGAAGLTIDAIGFGMADRLPELVRWAQDRPTGAGALDVAFRLEENHWQGRTRLQARIVDLRRTDDSSAAPRP